MDSPQTIICYCLDADFLNWICWKDANGVFGQKNTFGGQGKLLQSKTDDVFFYHNSPALSNCLEWKEQY